MGKKPGQSVVSGPGRKDGQVTILSTAYSTSSAPQGTGEVGVAKSRAFSASLTLSHEDCSSWPLNLQCLGNTREQLGRFRIEPFKAGEVA